MNRRQFSRICSSLIVAAGATGASTLGAAQAYARSTLFRDVQTPLLAADLEVGRPYVFFYPFVSTPSFLIHLGGDTENPIVAYSAICSHKMSHPAKEISFINYRHDEIEFVSREGALEKRSRLISCCSERSVYDPTDNAAVLGGPAPHPLARIELEHDSQTDQLTAIGSTGADMYERFFEKFGFRAQLEHRVSDVRAASAEQLVVQPVDQYSRQTIQC
jgi:Rieske Fe-S protein